METDYLVIGAGLAGMAFTDALLAETDARVTIVDRRHAPGGHWNDAYPFVRLHQPSAFYGVASGNLGEDRIDATGPNAGFYERATGAEVCHHFQEVMDETFVGSGRVEFVAMHDADDHGDGTATVRSRVTGASRDVTVRKKVVDARFLESSVPATHTPGFTVDDGARCIPVNGIVRDGGTADGYVILGAGKTAMDACVWLLEQGVDPDEITWVKPREPWVTDRGAIQPRDKVGDFIKGYAASVEASAHATSIRDLFERLEAGGSLHRIDAGVDPTMFRGSLLSEHERTQLRSIENVVRAGRVRRIQRSVMQMDGGPVTVTPGALFVDCTAVGLRTPHHARSSRRLASRSRTSERAARPSAPPSSATWRQPEATTCVPPTSWRRPTPTRTRLRTGYASATSAWAPRLAGSRSPTLRRGWRAAASTSSRACSTTPPNLASARRSARTSRRPRRPSRTWRASGVGPCPRRDVGQAGQKWTATCSLNRSRVSLRRVPAPRVKSGTISSSTPASR